MASGRDRSFPGSTSQGSLGITSDAEPTTAGPSPPSTWAPNSPPSYQCPTGAPSSSKGTNRAGWIRTTASRATSASTHSSLRPQDPSPWAAPRSEISAFLDVPVNLDAFRQAEGGKCLLAHGLVDVLVSARATEGCCRRLRPGMGSTNVESFTPLTTESPGYGHAVSTTFSTSPGCRLTHAGELGAEQPQAPPATGDDGPRPGSA